MNSIAIYNPISGEALANLSSVKQITEKIAPRLSRENQIRLEKIVISAMADMMTGLIVSCEIYDFTDGMRHVGVIATTANGAPYSEPLMSTTLAVHQDSIEFLNRPPSSGAVKLALAIMEGQYATKH